MCKRMIVSALLSVSLFFVGCDVSSYSTSNVSVEKQVSDYQETGRCSGITKQLDSYFKSLVADKTFSGSVLVAKEGKILLSEGYFKRNVDEGKNNNEATIHSIASLSKAFTSMSIMILKERGCIKLDDYVEKYIPEFPYKRKVKIRNLLNHTSGIYEFTNNPQVMEDNFYHKPKELLQYFINEPLNFEPGTQWEYSNSNYILLGIIIESLSGMDFNRFIKKNILKPLRMTRTGLDSYDCRPFTNYSIGYDDIFSDPAVEALYFHPSISYTAGGMYSTVEDMYKWDQTLYTNRLVSYRSLRELFTPVLNNYGMGWWNSSVDIDGTSYKVIWHYGAYFGYHGYFARFVDDGITVILLLNKSPVTGTEDELLPMVKNVVRIVQ